MKFAIPPRLAVDADGYVWRIFDDQFVGELWSVATVNLDNEPTPEPVTFYVPIERVAEELDEVIDRLSRVQAVPIYVAQLRQRVAELRDNSRTSLTVREVRQGVGSMTPHRETPRGDSVTNDKPCRRVHQWWAHLQQQDWCLTHRNAWSICEREGRQWVQVKP